MQEGNGVLEISIKVLCWEMGAGGRSVHRVSALLCRGFMLVYSSKLSREQRFPELTFSNTLHEAYLFWLKHCNWRPGKIPMVWGIAEEMFYT